MLLLCTLLFWNSSTQMTRADSEAYFVALNDVILPLQASTLPIWVDGFFCLPYTVFDSETTGGNLGLSSTYLKGSNMVNVYYNNDTLLFDLEAGICLSGTTYASYPFSAVVRNGVPYLPVTIICSYFFMEYSYHNTSYGYMVRITNGNQNLTTNELLRQEGISMKEMLEDFVRGPIPVEPSVEEVKDSYYCLGIEVGDEEIDMTELLDHWKIYGVFFFTAQQLETQGDYIRKLLSQGHRIGFRLLTQDSSEEEALLELGQCQALLFQQSRHWTYLVSVSSGLQSALEGAGYLCWKGGAGKEVVNATSFVRSLNKSDNTLYLTLRQSDSTTQQWTQLMNRLGEEMFIPLMPTESNL